VYLFSVPRKRDRHLRAAEPVPFSPQKRPDVNDQELAELVDRAKSLECVLGQASDLLDPVRPSANDLAIQVSQAPEIASEEILPGATNAELAGQCAEAVETAVTALAAASGNLALLVGSLTEEE
jgi:hypothetical protein